MSPANLHATAIVVGTRGLLFTGPSGSGKSTLAFACLSTARARGAFAALVADDQIFVEVCGEAVLAKRPPAIHGLLEIRGSGIVAVDSIAEARMDLAIGIVDAGATERLPPQDEELHLAGGGCLPMIRMVSNCRDPLAVIAAMRPEFRQERPF